MHLAKQARKNGINLIVLDPLLDSRWIPDMGPEAGRVYHTDDPVKFNNVARRSENCCLFIDEAGENVGQHNPYLHWTATRSRHQGHSAIYISQRGTQIAKIVRDQCSRLYLFCTSKSDGKIHADEWNCDALLDCHLLPPMVFYDVGRFGKSRLLKVDHNLKVKNIKKR